MVPIAAHPAGTRGQQGRALHGRGQGGRSVNKWVSQGLTHQGPGICVRTESFDGEVYKHYGQSGICRDLVLGRGGGGVFLKK